MRGIFLCPPCKICVRITAMKEKLENLIKETLKSLAVEAKNLSLEHPEDLSHGDYSTNVAMASAKELGRNPKELAEEIKNEIEKNLPDYLSKIETAGPGFINFHLSPKFFIESLADILDQKNDFGKNKTLAGKKAIVEYTDPNPFKEFHIGHLMSNAIGESLSRLVQWSGAETKRACYQGDVGLHVAKTIWALLKNGKTEIKNVQELGEAYAFGSKAYTKETQKKEIDTLNKKIYDRSDETINSIYDQGKKISLEHFEKIYQKFGTKFDYYFFESETGQSGKEIVFEFLKKGIFEESDGAIIFKAEKYDPKLHTRVFINSLGLPTYEAKELGLVKIKHDKYPYDLSIVITGNEVNDYFKVLLKALELIYPDLREKTSHISHGMLRLPTGKMSSRTGDVITGESILEKIEEMVLVKIKDRGFDAKEAEDIAKAVSVGAIKYAILKQALGKDIIFDLEKSISFDGDSGPYLQYAFTRSNSILEKAKGEGIKAWAVDMEASPAGELEKLLYRFPEIVLEARELNAPHHILTYLVNLAQGFNGYYARTKIIDLSDPASSHKVALTEAFSIVMKNGLYILGIQAPEKM